MEINNNITISVETTNGSTGYGIVRPLNSEDIINFIEKNHLPDCKFRISGIDFPIKEIGMYKVNIHFASFAVINNVKLWIVADNKKNKQCPICGSDSLEYNKMLVCENKKCGVVFIDHDKLS